VDGVDGADAVVTEADQVGADEDVPPFTHCYDMCRASQPQTSRAVASTLLSVVSNSATGGLNTAALAASHEA